MKRRNIIVTGGFGILGRSVAAAFRSVGDHVVRVDFASDAADDNSNGMDLGGVDLTDPAAALRTIDQSVAQFGGIDVLVNVAGGFVWEKFDSAGPDIWARMHAMNIDTCVNMTRAALPALHKSEAGRIINIGAVGALSAAAGMGAYAASKSGVHRLTESLAAELSGSTVTVNAVLPTIIDTPANRADMPDIDPGHWVRPNAIADVIVFLASPQARAINGALVPVSRSTPN